jgi:hypothetical protein
MKRAPTDEMVVDPIRLITCNIAMRRLPASAIEDPL